MQRPGQVLEAPPGPNHRPPDTEVTTMAEDSHYRDSAHLRKVNKSKTEVWRPVPSEPGVLVSSLGRFLLPPRYAPLPNGGYRVYTPKPRFGVVARSNTQARHTYLLAMVYRTGEESSRQRPRKVHQLVCEAFHGAKPFSDAVVIHLNEDAHDNRPENLRWGTQKENLNASGFRAFCRQPMHLRRSASRHEVVA